MNRFEPAGAQARWRTIYDLLQTKHVDDVVTYDEMGDALNLHPKDDRHIIQMAMRRAAHELEAEDKRAVESVTNRGYRIVHAEEHIRLARSQQRRASRALVRGESKVVNVDFNGMDPITRKGFEFMALAFGQQRDMMRRLANRQASLERDIHEARQEAREQSDLSSADIEALKARLARLEEGWTEPPSESVSD